MDSNKLKRAAIISTIIAIVSFLIVVMIGAASGTLQSMIAGTYHFIERGGADVVTIDEKKSMQMIGIQSIAIGTVSEDIIIHESSDKSIKAWFHGKASSVSSKDRPRLEINQNGALLEINTKWHSHIMFNRICDVVLEISVPKRYIGKLSINGVSSDITLESHDYKELSLTTVSGNIKASDVRAIAGDLDIHSTSGDVALNFTKTPSNITVETVSGNVNIKIPADSEFILNSDSISGDITSDFPITLTKSDADGIEQKLIGTIGSDKNIIRAHTVSGDINIARN
jgi:DUF4097 and DUF4098 domain-containing protein YvlB